eukprot:gene18009-18246_t
MQIGVVGLGRMGGNIVRRLMRAGHDCVVHDANPKATDGLAGEGAQGAGSVDEFVGKLGGSPKVVWLMLPAGAITEQAVADFGSRLSAGDILIDGGNSYYKDDVRRAKVLAEKGIHYLDIGTSGGVWGLERGYCMMIGGAVEAVATIDPILAALAPGLGSIPLTPGREGRDPRVEQGYLHAGPAGAGHFVKMIHNGIEYGMMQAMAEGFDILRHRGDAHLPEGERFDLDMADIAEVWRRGSVVTSWLLDLSSAALAKDGSLDAFSGNVADSGEGRWTIEAAIEEAVPADTLASALFVRFRSRQEHTFAEKMLSAMRLGFGGHSMPIIAPLLMAGAGLAPERIGNLSSLNSIGAVFFLMFGGPLLVRWGPVRSLQIGGLVCVLGLGLVASGAWPLLMVGAFLMGLGYGPSPPAGSRILSATAPARHRTLIFSIKQAGAPAGGAVAGLVLAPVASHFGWPASLMVAMGVGLVAVMLIAPARARLDVERVSSQRIGLGVLFNPRLVVAPFRTLAGNRAVLSVTTLAFSFAASQGCLFSFSITYLVTGLGMSLSGAGVAYATMQASGVFARIFLGWLADRTGRPALNLTVQAFVAAGMVLVYAALPMQPSVALAAVVCGATGFVAASWNGIYMAEIARLAAPERIVEATSSSSVVTFLGYVSGPSLFSFLVSATGSWTIPFVVMAVQLAAMAVVQAWFLMAGRRGVVG